MSTPILVALGALNLYTFLAFGWDKRLARLGHRRTPEARLLGLAFVGGFPGAWLGMRTFRHKTIKRSFRLRMVAVSVLNPLWLAAYLYYSRR